MQCGFSLTQIGEFAFIIASLGVSLHVTTPFFVSYCGGGVCHHYFPYSLYDSFGRARFQSCGYAFAGKMEKVLDPLCFRFADHEPRESVEETDILH